MDFIDGRFYRQVELYLSFSRDDVLRILFKIPLIFIRLMSTNGRSHRKFFPPGAGNGRARLFPPAICDSFNFRAIVDYIRDAICVTRELASTAQPGSPFPSPLFLIRIQLFSRRPPFRGFSIYEINCYAVALRHSVEKKKKNYLGELAAIPYLDYTARSAHCGYVEYVYTDFFPPLTIRFLSCETLALSI